MRIPSDYLDHQEYLDFQWSKILEVLQYADSNSKYYRSLFLDHQIDVHQFFSWEHFKSIPFTSKDHLQQFNMDFLCTPISEISEYVTTSGTLGSPVSILLTEKDVERLAYNEARGLSMADIDKNDVIQITTTLDRRFMAGLAYYLGARSLNAGIIRVGVGVPELQWESIDRFKPTVLIAVPSFVVKLIEYAKKQQLDINLSTVKKIICIGEAIRNQDFTLNQVGLYISQLWNVKLFSTYASTEMATAFTECTLGKGGHELSELIYTEIIGEDGQEVQEGESGELVITTFGMEAMPLIRFKTGDIVIKHSTACACGRKTPRLSAVIGRKSQMIKIKGTTLYPAAIQQLLDQVPEIETYILEVFSNHLGIDELTIYVACSGDSIKLFSTLNALFKAHLRVTPNVEFRPSEFINHLKWRPESRKPIVIIDNRKK